MSQAGRVKGSQSGMVVVLVAGLALLAGLYYALRFGGWAMEGDSSAQVTAASGMIQAGKLVAPGAYTNGFAYPAQLTVTSLVTGVSVQDLQLGSSLWAVVVALAAFITYRELSGSSGVAGLGVLLLFLQPDFLFYIVRQGHEKYTWTFALLMVFLLLRSYHQAQKPWKLFIYIGLFYLLFWAFISSNVFFAATFMGALMLSFMGGWLLSWRRSKTSLDEQVKNLTLRRLIVIGAACLVLVYVFINYTYRPAYQFYYIFTQLSDRLSMLLLGTQPAETPAAYGSLGSAWRSSAAYLGLTGLQWLIAGLSVVAWGAGLRRLAKMYFRRWLAWLMYSAFGVILVIGTLADYAGYLSTNMQLRMFTPFAIFSSVLVAEWVVEGVRAMRLSWRKGMAVAGVVVLTIGSLTTVLKVTNDPAVGNQWLFYSPAELAPLAWMNRLGVQPNQTWIDITERLSRTYYFWEGNRPNIPNQYLSGRLSSPVPYTLISEQVRLRADRTGISLPSMDDQLQIYDNGQAQVYHRRPMTPYQH